MNSRLKYFFAVFALTTAFHIAAAQSVKNQYADGSLKSELKAPTKVDKPWTFVMYYPNHMMLTEGECRDGVVVGDQRMGWYDNGNRMYEFYMKDGLADGKLIMYYENGAKKLEGEFSTGKATGFWKLWTDKGVLLIHGEVLEDNRFRLIEARDVYREKIIDQGEGSLSYFRTQDWDGKQVTVKVEGKYMNGFKEGIWRVTTVEGKKVEEANFSQGFYHGKYSLYNPNGTHAAQRQFNNGFASGKWILSNSAGKVIKIDEYGEVDPDKSDSNLVMIVEEDGLLWNLPFEQTVPLTGALKSEWDTIISSLFQAAKMGGIMTFKNINLTVPVSMNSFHPWGLEDTIYHYSSEGRMTGTRVEYQLSDVSALKLRGKVQVEKMFCTYSSVNTVVGIQFGFGDTATIPIWIPWYYLLKWGYGNELEGVSMLNHNSYPSRMESLEIDEHPANLAERLYSSEKTWLEANTKWMFVQEEQLNLRGVNRKGL